MPDEATRRGAPNVSLVGAGPGGTDLITVRGRERLRRAEVVVYDELIHRAHLEEAPAGAERVYVGKRQGARVMEQEAIDQLLVERARRGLRVVRLKGGDPLVFGRGGEEALALARAGVPYEVVPGVSSVSAVPACAGIPLTQRGLADGFEVWTGHAEPVQGKTAVVLMGLRRLPENVALLRRAGHPGDTPAAVIQWGTLPRQRTVVATLETIAAAAAGMESPAILVVGEVVALREELRWFERLPLFGRRVLVTRSRAQSEETCRALEALGAEVVPLPTIAIVPPADLGPLERAVSAIASYDTLILTSANALAPLRAALERAGRDSRALAGIQICAIGPGTADALAAMGLRADLVPEDHRAEGILELLDGIHVRGTRILLPRAARAREILPETLRQRGATVEVVPVYETVLPDPELTRPGLEALAAGGVDVLTFTSASTVENFATLLGDRLAERCAGMTVAAIGPVTREACTRVGLEVQVMPERYTIPALVEALVAHFGG